jgi:hydroxymethylbilane synthase
MPTNILRIGTRESELARQQAHEVKDILETKNFLTELVSIKSDGDMDLTKPIYSLGIQGVFTKTLDIALLENQIDIAVHSLKDVPTQLPQGLILGAVLKRNSARDVLVYKEKPTMNAPATIATGSLRRKAQWLNHYPNHEIVNLRGNVNTRMDKLKNSDWQGAIFAKAGLKRVALLGSQFQELNWMIPAPAQGAIGIICRTDQVRILNTVKSINDQASGVCVKIEREFLRLLEGGCTAPIGAFAQIDGDKILFEGGVFSLDGKKAITIKHQGRVSKANLIARKAVKEILSKGGDRLMETIRQEL